MTERSCFTCGAGPGSADLHVVALDERGLTTCFREHCQENALGALRDSTEGGMEGMEEFTLSWSWTPDRETMDV